MATFNGTWYQSNKFPTRVANLKWYGSTLQAKVDNMASQFYSLKAVYSKYPNFPGSSKCRCIAKQIVELESSWNPDKGKDGNAYYYDANGVKHYVRGLWQISDIHKTSEMAQWWPENNGYTLDMIYNAEYNTRYAFTFMNSLINSGKDPWTPWSTYNDAKLLCAK